MTVGPAQSQALSERIVREPDDRPLVLIACRVFQGLLDQHLPPEVVDQITFLDYGLHRVPDSLRMSVQAEIDALETPSVVVLGYGLCGNGLHGIRARQHTLLVSRADDCIAVLLGSYRRYIEEFEAEPGTYYLTKGWLESGSNPLSEFEEYSEKYGPDEAQWLMDQQYQHYKRLVLVAHSQQDLEHYRPQALEVAEYCQRWGMAYEEILGSETYVERLASFARSPEEADQEFIVVQPGGELKQAQFISRSDRGE
jgi:hypothetical protein